jgi:hypothetical protein
MSKVVSMSGRSPLITSLEWGRVEVAGGLGPFKDAKLFPGGAREWDWREAGTRHSPGIQPADLEELLERGVSAVVLSRGMWRRLGVSPATLQVLEARGIRVEVLQTERAVDRYNELAAKGSVGALIHSTC